MRKSAQSKGTIQMKSFPQALEDAARESSDKVKFAHTYNGDCLYSYDAIKDSFTSGAHFALKSELVREMMTTLMLYESQDENECRNFSPARSALTKYSDAMKEMEGK